MQGKQVYTIRDTEAMRVYRSKRNQHLVFKVRTLGQHMISEHCRYCPHNQLNQNQPLFLGSPANL